MKNCFILFVFTALVLPVMVAAKPDQPPVFAAPTSISPDGKKAYGRDIVDKSAQRSNRAANGSDPHVSVWCWLRGQESRRLCLYDTEAEGAHEVLEAELEWSPDSRYLFCTLQCNKYGSFMVIDMEAAKGPEIIFDDTRFLEVSPELSGSRSLGWALRWTAESHLKMSASPVNQEGRELLLEPGTGRILEVKAGGTEVEIRPARPASKPGFWQRLFHGRKSN